MKNRYLRTVIKVNEDFILQATKDDERLSHDNLAKIWKDCKYDHAVRNRELIKIVQDDVSSWLQLLSTRIEWSDNHLGIPEPRAWELDGLDWVDVPRIIFQQQLDREFS